MTKWPKIIPPLTKHQQKINDDYMKYWHTVFSSQKRFSLIKRFNHLYPVRHARRPFTTTLEIGAGLGDHLHYERLNAVQRRNYIALDLRENMLQQFKKNFPDINTLHADCQKRLPFPDGYFDRILAIHVLEHLPNLPAALQEIHRLSHVKRGIFSIVIPCEGGLAYNIARQISAKRIFEKKYNEPYEWFIKKEHINTPQEILHELKAYFGIIHRRYFPLFLPFIPINLCLGITLVPKIL